MTGDPTFGQPTGIFRSENQGDSWTPMGVPQSDVKVGGVGYFWDTAFAADPINPNLVYFGGWGGGSTVSGSVMRARTPTPDGPRCGSTARPPPPTWTTGFSLSTPRETSWKAMMAVSTA